jgi:hypothetical protein
MASIYQGSSYDTDTLKKLLNEAQSAYHSLATGTLAVKVSRNGRDVEFKQANMNDLRIYIQELQQLLGVNVGRGRAARICF